MWRPALDTKTLRTAEFVGAGLFVFFWGGLDVHPPTRKYLKEVVDTKGQSPQTSPNIPEQSRTFISYAGNVH